ncbi:hypothetical protein EDB83DRAFT_2555059 [Lactarius deliciosus]|nr:hypothetical protein EDB83DRAFT_2555059 [Lactarius deliciosus]
MSTSRLCKREQRKFQVDYSRRLEERESGKDAILGCTKVRRSRERKWYPYQWATPNPAGSVSKVACKCCTLGTLLMFLFALGSALEETTSSALKDVQELGCEARKVSRKFLRNAKYRIWVFGDRRSVGIQWLKPRASAAKLGMEIVAPQSPGKYGWLKVVAHVSARRETS